MKRLLSGAALALMMSTTAYAANELKPLQTYQADEQAKMQDILASNLIGMRIYSVEENFDRFNEDYAAKPDEEKEWDNIGEVDDVVLSFDGNVRGVVLGVGGFLGIGEKDIAIPMDQLKVVREQENPDDYFLVVNANKQTLTDAPAYDRSGMEDDMAAAGDEQPMTGEDVAATGPDQQMTDDQVAGTDTEQPMTEDQVAETDTEQPMTEDQVAETDTEQPMTGDQVAETETEQPTTDDQVAGTDTEQPMTGEDVETAETGNQPADDQMADAGATNEPGMAVDDRPLLPRANVTREGYEEASAADLTAEDLEDANVYDANDEDIGEIETIIISDSGEIEQIVLEVGGFLGIGEKSVAVTFDELQIIRSTDGSDLRVYVGATEEELEAQPTYEGQ